MTGFAIIDKLSNNCTGAVPFLYETAASGGCLERLVLVKDTSSCQIRST